MTDTIATGTGTPSDFTCPVCSKQFLTKRACDTHHWRAHVYAKGSKKRVVVSGEKKTPPPIPLAAHFCPNCGLYLAAIHTEVTRQGGGHA